MYLKICLKKGNIKIMKRKEYDIDKAFKGWNNINPPINKFSASVFQAFLKPLFYFEKSNKDCKVERKSIILNNKKVKFLIYTPKNLKDTAPCLIYYHGGGFMLPSAPYHYRNARRYAVECCCKVFIPDYPLAPKNKFPIPVNICFEFYKYLLENHKEFNIQPNKIIVGGDSAGGNLASIVCMMASDNKIQVPAAQMLIYPVIGIKEPTQSMLEFDSTGMCNNKDFEKYCKLYFKTDEDKSHRYTSPLNQEDLSMYPPTYIETAEFDCLRDEGILFAEKLKQNNVKVTTHFTKRTIHGYDIVKNNPIVEESLLKRINFIKQFNK